MRGLRTFFITILIALSFNSIHATLEEDLLESLHALLASDMPDPLRQKLHLLIVKKDIEHAAKLGLSPEYILQLLENEAAVLAAGDGEADAGSAQQVVEEEEPTCSICMEEFTTANPKVASKPFRCDHQDYHAQCILRWQAQAGHAAQRCPMCRAARVPN